MSRVTRVFEKRSALIVAVVVAALSVTGALAQDRAKAFRFGGFYVGPTGEFFEEVTGDTDTQLFLEGDSTEAFFIGYEHYVAENVSIEATLATYGLDIDGYFKATSRNLGRRFLSEFRAKTDIIPVTFGANRHFGSSEIWDFYIGAFLSYNFIDELEFTDSRIVFEAEPEPGEETYENPFEERETVAVKDELGWGVLVGLDLRFGADSKWFATSAVRYSRTAIEFDGQGADNSEIDIDPWLFQLGFGVTF